MPLARCSSGVISDAEGAVDRAAVAGRIVLAVSLVLFDAGVLPRGSSNPGAVKGRPLAESSEERPPIDDWPSLEGGKRLPPGLALSMLTLLVSKEGRV
jgi:hypothetical protein